MARTTAKTTAKAATKASAKGASKTLSATKAPAKRPTPKSRTAVALNKNSPPQELSADELNRMIEIAAYHIAERDGFRPGLEETYWVQGEHQIRTLLESSPQKHSLEKH